MSDIMYDIDRNSLSDRVYYHIKDLILSGELRPGEKVSEEKIATRFGVSRTPIREALKRLEEYGLVRIKPRAYAEVVSLQPDEAEDVSNVRAALEVLAVELLAERGTEDDFDAIANLADQCDERLAADDIAGTFEKDSDFHLEIARRTRNPHLCEIFEKLDSKVQMLRLVLHLPHDRLRTFVHQHQGIVSALRQRDAEQAHLLMRRHILGQLEHYQPTPSKASSDPGNDASSGSNVQ